MNWIIHEVRALTIVPLCRIAVIKWAARLSGNSAHNLKYKCSICSWKLMAHIDAGSCFSIMCFGCKMYFYFCQRLGKLLCWGSIAIDLSGMATAEWMAVCGPRWLVSSNWFYSACTLCSVLNQIRNREDVVYKSLCKRNNILPGPFVHVHVFAPRWFHTTSSAIPRLFFPLETVEFKFLSGFMFSHLHMKTVAPLTQVLNSYYKHLATLYSPDSFLKNKYNVFFCTQGSAGGQNQFNIAQSAFWKYQSLTWSFLLSGHKEYYRTLWVRAVALASKKRSSECARNCHPFTKNNIQNGWKHERSDPAKQDK